MGIRIVKIKGRGRVTLRLRVVEKWKGKREVMVESSEEKWEMGGWDGLWCDLTRT